MSFSSIAPKKLKKCRTCNQLKPTGGDAPAFYSNKGKRDGLTSYCTECLAEVQRANRRKAKEKRVAPAS